MADFDALQPVRTTATNFTTEVANASGTTINPSEDYAQGSTTSGQNGVLLQGAVTTAAPTYTTATTNPLSLDTSGNLRVLTTASGGTQSVIGGETAESTAAWTSSTTVDTVLTQTVSGYNTVLVTFNQTSTITGGVATFEVSDTTGFTNAYPVQATELNGFVTGTTYTFVASTNQAFLVNVAAAAAFRVRLSTVITGTGTVNVGIQANGMATEPSATVGGTVTGNQGSPNIIANAWPIKITDGTNIATVNASNELLVTDTDLTLSQGSTTSGQFGPLIQGAVTTANPSYTTGQTDPLSLTTAGALRTDIEQVGGSAISLGQKTSANSFPVVIASDQSPINVQIGGITPVVTYNTDVAVASGASVSHTVSGPAKIDAIWASASGELKVVIAIGVSGSEANQLVGFTSASNKIMDWKPTDAISIPSGQDVKVTLTNFDKQAMDIYLTIITH